MREKGGGKESSTGLSETYFTLEALKEKGFFPFSDKKRETLLSSAHLTK